MSGGEGLAHPKFMTRSPQIVRRVDLVRSDEIERELTVMRQPVLSVRPAGSRPTTREVSGSTTTISPEVGLTPESAWMFAPCVTTISVPSVHVLKIAFASCLNSSRRSLNTKALLNAGSMSTGPRPISFAVSTQRHQGELMILVKDMPFTLICAPIATASARPLSLEIPLSGAVVELEACWIAGSARSITMAHQRDVPAFAQGVPSGRRVRRRGRHGNYERNDSYDLEHTERGFEVASPERGTFNLSPPLTDSTGP